MSLFSELFGCKPIVKDNNHQEEYNKIFALQKEARNNKIKELELKFPLGSDIEYLGVKCLVTHCETIGVEFHYTRFGPVENEIKIPMLKADYVDKNGKINQLQLSYEEAIRLK